MTQESPSAGSRRKQIAAAGGAVLGATVLFAPAADAATITVNSLADNTNAGDAQCTIREALANANSNSQTTGGDCVPGSGADTINLTALAGTITLGGTQLTISDSTTITGPGAGTLTIDAATNSRVLYAYNNAAALTIGVSGVTITRGRGANGGGIISKGELLTLTNDTISNSVATGGGGGVANVGGSLTLQSVTLSGNTAQSVQGGAGIYDVGGALTVNQSTITGNTASSIVSRGGAISILSTTQPTVISNTEIRNNSTPGKGAALGVKTNASGGTVTVNDTVITGNTATGRGGAMFLYRTGGAISFNRDHIDNNTTQNRGAGMFLYNISANIDITDTSISGNSAPTAAGNGGGIFFYRSAAGTALTLTRDTIANNSVNRSGGGMFFYKGSGTLAIIDTTVAGNTAGTVGGGIFDRGPFGGTAALKIEESTFAGNSAATSGGNLSVTTVPTTIKNSVIANGTSPSGPDAATGASNVTMDYSLLENTSGATFSGTGDITGTDPALGPLQDNAGYTFTEKPNNGSPLLDAGDPAFTPPPAVDGRGRARVANGRLDIGAVEVQSFAILAIQHANPDSPAQSRTPSFRGTAPDGAQNIAIYTNSNCSGAPIGVGTAAAFTSSGIPTTLPDDGTYTIYAASRSGTGNVQECTSTGFDYIADATPPDAPALTRFSPSSPGPAGMPKIFGTAESASRVKIYTNAACTGTPIASAPGSDFATNGIQLPTNVPTNTSQSFYATQTDAANNISPCGGPFTYVADSTPPVAPTLGSVSPAGPANNNTPRVIGTAEAGSTVRVYANSACTGSPLATGTAAAFASPGLLISVSDDTTTTLYATATDAAGNVSPCGGSVSYVEDSTAPGAPGFTAFSPASPSPNHTPKITGTAAAGSTVKVYTSSDCSGTPVASGTPATFASPGLQLPAVADSTSTGYYVTATDTAGNASLCAGPFTYVNDVGTPAAPTLSSFTPASPSSDNNPRLKGSAPTGSTVSIYTNAACTGTPVATGTAAQLANTGIALTVAADSTTEFYATATSAAGNVSSCAGPLRYVEDSTAPTAPTVGSVSPVGPSNDHTPRVKGTAETGSTVRVYTNAACTGTPYATGTQAEFSGAGIQVPPLPDNSTTTFYATAVDAAGNASACSGSGVTYVQQSTAPAAPSSLGFTPSSPSPDRSPKLTGTAATGSTVKVYTSSDCTGTPVATGTAAAFASPGLQLPTVSQGSTTSYYATATDTAGNTSACAGPATYANDVTDPAAPTLTGFAPASPANENAPRLKGTAPTGSTVSIYTNAACTGTPAATGTAAQLANTGIALAVADDTSTGFYATATSAAGNVSTCVGPITYVEDSTPPAAPTLSAFTPSSPSNANTPRVTGSAAAGSTVRVYDNAACTGTPLGTGTAAELASPGIAFSVPDDSSTDLYAVAVDAAGNVSGCAGPLTYVEDSTAPSAPTLTGFTPASGADENAPKLRGSAAAGTIIRVYTNAACSGFPVAVGTDADLAAPGITVGVGDNTTTTFYVTATDAAGNESACSGAATYQERSPIVIIGQPPQTGSGATTPSDTTPADATPAGSPPPPAGTPTSSGSKAEDCKKMPKLTKHSLAYAIQLLEQAHCGDNKLVIKGKVKGRTPIVHAQTPKAGSNPSARTTITITLR